MSAAEKYYQSIVLNNLGVALLEKRAYSQAMETFRSALNGLKMVIRPTREVDEDADLAISSKIEKAYQTLARMGQDTESENEEGARMVFNSSGLHLPSVLNLIMDGYFSAATSPIWIEVRDLDKIFDRDTDLDSALILFNFGLVHRCLAAQERDWEKHIHIHKAALRLFCMSFTLISETELPMGRSFEEGQAMGRHRMHAGAVFLYFQVRTYFDMQRLADAQEAMRHLSMLQSDLVDMMDMGFTFESPCPAAAAA
jgi:hypothetical protein